MIVDLGEASVDSRRAMVGMGPEEQVDALIVTAVPEEYAAVLDVHTGAVAGSEWEKREASTKLEVAYRSFETPGGILRIAVTQALGMGGVEAVNVAGPLIDPLGVRCLAMCGVCAGRRGKVELGDVIIADRVWQYDTGKNELADIRMHLIRPPRWEQAAPHFEVPRDSRWLSQRPLSYETQGNWVLQCLLAGEAPNKHPERPTQCPNYAEVITWLRVKRWLRKDEISLTQAGRKRIKGLLDLHPDGLPRPKPFDSQVGPIASGNKVKEDPKIFDRLAKSVRKILGLEMEVAAIGALAHLRQLEFSVVMKGVMDHADGEKSDHFKPFAARASAECLIAFLRQHLPPRELPKATRDPLDDILVPGTSDLPAKASPAALLNARHEVVDFFGREELIAKLRAWCEKDEKSVGTRLIYGAGGMGKTRLFIELCKRMREEAEWRAGFVPKGLEVERFAELVADDRPTLAVIDYAESRPNLRALLEPVAKRRSDGREGRVRVVLLARNAGDWWDTLLSADGDVKDLLSEEEILMLELLVPVASERDPLFRKAVQDFAKHLAKPVPEQPAPSLENKRFERVLYVQMAALAYAEGRSFTAESLMDDTLDHEQRFWGEAFPKPSERAERVLVSKFRRLVSALTLEGGAESEVEALDLVGRFYGLRDEEVLVFLRDLYPGQQTQDATYLSGLEPDLLGEAMVWRTLAHEGKGAGAYLDRVFESAGGRALRAGFTVLGRLSEEHAEAEAWIARVLDRDVAGRALPAFEATKTVGERTAYSPIGNVLAKALKREGTAEIAERIETAGLPGQTVLLREVALWATATRLAQLREGPETLAERARLLGNLSGRQSELGKIEEALISARMAVAIRRELAEAQPEAFQPYLAGSLSSLGARQSELGLREEALASTREAVDLYRKLVEVHPEVFQPHLAMSLNNLGIRQSELGLCEEALASTQEAVNLYRKLDTVRPEAFQPYLAGSLSNLGARQSELGLRAEALASTQEAMDIRRKLAELRPDAFQSDLVTSLMNLGAMQRGLGLREEALASTQKAVANYRKLVVAHSEAFQPYLAASLMNLGMMQSELGQREKALASTREAVDLYQKLAVARSKAFQPYLAASLMNLGMVQSKLGQREKAFISTQEAVDNYRKLVAAYPESFQHYLATSLINLGTRQSELGLREEALASAQEAVDIRRKLAEVRLGAFQPYLAAGLATLGTMQSALGLRKEALASTREAVDIYRKLAAAYAAAFQPDLAQSLTSLGIMQSALGLYAQALASAQEALDIRRKLVEVHPEAFLPDLAGSLINLSARQGTLGLREEALAPALEAVDLYRKLVEARPEAFQPDLAMGLYSLGLAQSELGLGEEALASTREAVDLYRKLASACSDAFLPNLAGSLNNLATIQSELGLREEALVSIQEAVDTRRKLAEARPEVFQTDLAGSLTNLGLIQSALGQHEEALISTQEALKTIWPFFMALPNAFAKSTNILLLNVLKSLEVLGHPPTLELLERIESFKAKLSDTGTGEG